MMLANTACRYAPPPSATCRATCRFLFSVARTAVHRDAGVDFLMVSGWGLVARWLAGRWGKGGAPERQRGQHCAWGGPGRGGRCPHRPAGIPVAAPGLETRRPSGQGRNAAACALRGQGPRSQISELAPWTHEPATMHSCRFIGPRSQFAEIWLRGKGCPPGAKPFHLLSGMVSLQYGTTGA